MKFSIQENLKEALLSELSTANVKFQQTYPGDKPDRQPVHTVYGGANLFKSDTCVRMGEIALRSLQTDAPNFVVLANVLGLQGHNLLPQTEGGVENLAAKMEGLTEDQRKLEPAWLSHAV